MEKLVWVLWKKLQEYICNGLVYQRGSSSKEVGEYFEKLVKEWIRESNECKYVLSPNIGGHPTISGCDHEFDIICALRNPATYACLLECKTFVTNELSLKIPALIRYEIEHFLFKCYDSLPENFLTNIKFNKVFPVIISTKPLSHSAFKIAWSYGITVIQPSQRSLLRFLKQLRLKLKEMNIAEVQESIKNLNFLPPPFVAKKMLKEKAEVFSEVKPRVQEIESIIRAFPLPIGKLPKRGDNFRKVLYKKYLDIVRYMQEKGIMEGIHV